MVTSGFTIDRIYKKMIKALQENSRITNLQLAEEVNLSPSACLKRIKKLEAQGYIRRYTTNLNIHRMCECISVLANFYLTHSRGSPVKISFEKAIAETPTATECYQISGEADYIVHFICSDVEQYEAVTSELMQRDIGIARIVSNVILSTPKPFKDYPLDELHWKLDSENENAP